MADSKPAPKPDPPRVGDVVAGVSCPRCKGELAIAQLGSEAHLVRCRKCGFAFACELGDV